MGTRLKGVLSDRPKPMALVDGRPFLEWVLLYLSGQGITRFTLSTGHLGEIVEAHFERGMSGAQISCVREREPLGTAGGFLNCAASVETRPDWWVVCNGDSLAVADLTEFLSCADEDLDGAILGVEMEDAARYGTLSVSDEGALLGFAEKRPGRGLINAGVYLLRDEFARSLGAPRPLSFERDVFPRALEDGRRFRVTPSAGAFLDIGTPDSLALAEAFVKRSLRPALADGENGGS